MSCRSLRSPAARALASILVTAAGPVASTPWRKTMASCLRSRVDGVGWLVLTPTSTRTSSLGIRFSHLVRYRLSLIVVKENLSRGTPHLAVLAHHDGDTA